MRRSNAQQPNELLTSSNTAPATLRFAARSNFSSAITTRLAISWLLPPPQLRLSFWSTIRNR